MNESKLIAKIPFSETTELPVTSRLRELWRMLQSFTFSLDALKFIEKEIDFEVSQWQRAAKIREFYARPKSGVVMGPP